MDDKLAISVLNVGKKYSIGVKKEGDLRSTLSNILRTAKQKGEDFWALQDLNFEIKKGEVVGIIGRNGAGKSTLLKILSQITKPTTGKIEINGRVASLLEVGTGFHPELTGRENIYLNGTILGMSRKEVKSKFNEIVEFSGVEKFIDTAVKHYSSGMYVRLAFAVAAHLEPEILIIDEVLAVGDAEFQKKCLGKMKDVAGQGRTVLFVSHNIAAVKNLCSRSILLDNGQLINFDETAKIVDQYINLGLNKESLIWRQNNTEKPVYFQEVELSLEQEKSTVHLKIKLGVNSEFPKAFFAFYISDSAGTPLFEAIPIYRPFIEKQESNDLHFEVSIELPNMIPGFYYLGIWIGNDHQYTLDWQQEIIRFEITKNPLPERVVAFPDHAGVAFLTSHVQNHD